MAKAGGGRRESTDLGMMNSKAHKVTMTGSQPFKRMGTQRGASTSQVKAMCRNLKIGTTMSKTHACAISTVAWFFGINRVPQFAPRVEQISEWIMMWHGFKKRYQNARSVNFEGKLCKSCQTISVAGAQQRDRFPLLSVQYWRLDGNQSLHALASARS